MALENRQPLCSNEEAAQLRNTESASNEPLQAQTSKVRGGIQEDILRS